MTDHAHLEKLFAKHGCTDFTWLDPGMIVLGQWVRMKCIFGCKDFGKTATCPPNTPTVDDCRGFFSEYKTAVLFHFTKKLDKPDDRHAWTRKINGRLIKLERSVFLAGYYKALVLYVDPCNFCEDCSPNKEECQLPEQARPSPEGLAVDVFATARKNGYKIEVLTKYTEEMNRFGILLIE